MEFKVLNKDTKYLSNIFDVIDLLKNPAKESIEIEKIRNNLSNIYTDTIQQYKADFNAKMSELFKYFGKYVRIWVKNPNTDEVKQTYDAYLYRYVPTNGYLFGIYNFHKDYFGGLQDTSIDIVNIFRNYNVDVQEITKSEFLAEAKICMEMCLQYRLNKIKNDNYKFVEGEGYKHIGYNIENK